MAQDYELTKHVLREMHSLNERNEVVATGAAMAIASIDDLLKQRTELLELLEYVKDAYDFSGELSAQSMRKIEAAITKTEAAE